MGLSYRYDLVAQCYLGTATQQTSSISFMTCLSLWASLQQQSAFARLFLETCQDSTTGVCGNVTLFFAEGNGETEREQAEPIPSPRPYFSLSLSRPQDHFPQGPSPFTSVPLKREGGGKKPSPEQQPSPAGLHPVARRFPGQPGRFRFPLAPPFPAAPRCSRPGFRQRCCGAAPRGRRAPRSSAALYRQPPPPSATVCGR